MSINLKTSAYLRQAFTSLDKRQRKVFLLLSTLRTLSFGIDVGAILLLVTGVNQLSARDGNLAGIFLAIATIALFIRSLVTLYISRSTFKFLSQVEVVAGGRFTEAVFSAPQEKLDVFRSQDLAFALNQGTNSFTTRTLGFFLIVVSDGLALIGLVLVFSFVYPLEGAMMVFLVLSVVVPVQRFVTRRIHESAADWSAATIEMLQQIQEFQTSRREIFLNSAAIVMSNRLAKYRNTAASSSARFNFMLTVPRTVIEVSTLAVAAILLTFSYIRMSSSDFIVFSAMLMAVVFRVAPLAIGVVGALGVISQSQGETVVNRKLLSDLSETESRAITEISLDPLSYVGAVIDVRDISYSFPGVTTPVFKNVTLEISANEVCAIVGLSGSGKTTLLDCLMGLRSVSNGSVQLFGKQPDEVRQQFPGTMGLVTQTPSIRSASIAENVAFFSSEGIDEERVFDLLIHVGLQRFLDRQTEGVNTLIGDGYIQMSGGEKQRLALARALYRNPKILIMDEPTSALDGLSEGQVFELIQNEKTYRTIILVTHRQPHNMTFDKVYEVSDGKVSRNFA